MIDVNLLSKFKTKNLFIILVFFLAIISILTEHFLNLRILTEQNLLENLTNEQVSELIIFKQKWLWLFYLLIPIIIVVRTLLLTFCLNIGLFLYDVNNKVSFNKLYRVALIGEFVLIFVSCFKFFYFFLIRPEYTLLEFQQFYPLSYINFLDLSKIDPWLIYPLQTINLFEIAYFFVLVYGLHKLLKNKYSKSFEIVAVSYGSGLVIWLGLVMFLTLNMS
ncbi:hypothetical protein [Polaribacter sp. R77954]|uniref:hypothetical protein n=1 Tax=Polaribacter sp. R77954 TaxID=3093870 RepID=UPI0037C84F4A